MHSLMRGRAREKLRAKTAPQGEIRINDVGAKVTVSTRGSRVTFTTDFTKFLLFPSAVRAPLDSPDAVAGALRWPWMLPFAEPEAGNAVRQEAAWNNLASWDKPTHVIFGDSDQVFTEKWGRQFAAHISGATFTSVKVRVIGLCCSLGPRGDYSSANIEVMSSQSWFFD
jgi:pimeloyl-ACP methyl ester carboxylesterase